MGNHEVVNLLKTFKFQAHSVTGLSYSRTVEVQCESSTGLATVPVTIMLLADSLEWHWQGVMQEALLIAKFGIISEGQPSILMRTQADMTDVIRDIASYWPDVTPTEQGKNALVDALRGGFEVAAPHFFAIERAKLPVIPMALPLDIAGGSGMMHLRLDTDYPMGLFSDGSTVFLIEATTGYEHGKQEVLMIEVSMPATGKCTVKFADAPFIRTFIARMTGQDEAVVNGQHVERLRTNRHFRLTLELLCQEVHRTFYEQIHQVYVQLTGRKSA